MGLNSTALDLMLNALDESVTVLAYGSLHTDAIGGGSGNEVTGGAPAYARKALTWNPASGGTKALTATLPVWDVPAVTVRRVGFFSAVSAGTYYGDAEITDEVFAAQGTYTLTAGSVSLT
jgi:hypothetical protein